MRLTVDKKVFQYVVDIKDGKINILKHNGKITNVSSNLDSKIITILDIKTKTKYVVNQKDFINSFWDTTEIKALEKLYRFYSDWVNCEDADYGFAIYWQNVAIKETIKNKIYNMKNKKPNVYYPYHKRKAAMDRF